MAEIKHPLRVFLCHASADKPAVRQLFTRLMNDGVDAWLDEENLIPGQNWKVEIPRAVRDSDVVIVCLSSFSLTKEGFVQKEIKIALDAADEKPEGTIFIIPARLENCDVPERINSFQWVDLFSENGYERLLKALQIRANNLGVTIKRKKSPSKAAVSPKYSKIAKLETDEKTNEEIVEETSLIKKTDADNLSKEDHIKEEVIPDGPPIQQTSVYVEDVQIDSQMSFSVWYADSKKFNSTSKLKMFTDKGNLKAKNGTLIFEGKKINLQFSQISQMSFVREKTSWGTFLILLAFIILIAFTVIPAENRSILVFVLPMWILGAFLAMTSRSIYKWVRIDFVDLRGDSHSAFFLDLSKMGFGGLSAGLYKELSKIINVV